MNLRYSWGRPVLAGGAALAAVALACGGGGTKASGGGVGESTSDLDPGGAPMADAGAPPADAEPPPAPITFVLKNTAGEELAFNMDRGWQPNLFAYSGKPPKAKSILMFATHCTASCETPEEERCPLCPEPEKLKDIRESQKLERVAAGGEIKVPWDGNIFVYQKTKGTRDGKNKRCQCYTTEPAPPETYTVKACGLRLTTEVGKNTQLQCVEGEMTLPVTEPIQVELEFPAPAPQGKKKKKK